MRRRSGGSAAGFSLIETLLTLVISGIVITAAFRFYVSTNQQVTAQQQITEMQLISRTCMEEITTAARPAGYLLTGHPAFRIGGDTLSIYKQSAGAIDSLRYFLEEFTDEEYLTRLPARIAGMRVYKLMRQEGATAPVSFADYITQVQYTAIGASTIAITIEVQATAPDESYQLNNGFRTFINTERVFLQNVT